MHTLVYVWIRGGFGHTLIVALEAQAIEWEDP
jgi:hypothetical protein